MLEFNAYLAAQHITREASFNSCPQVPALPVRASAVHRPHLVAARQRLSLSLRRLADVIQPVGTGMNVPLPASR